MNCLLATGTPIPFPWPQSKPQQLLLYFLNHILSCALSPPSLFFPTPLSLSLSFAASIFFPSLSPSLFPLSLSKMAGDLAGLVSRLEAVTARLEGVAGAKGTAPAGGSSKTRHTRTRAPKTDTRQTVDERQGV